MTPRRSISIFMMTLPGLTFWIFWLVVWDSMHGPGENYWPLLIQIGLLGVSSIAFLGITVTGLVKKTKVSESIDWWIAALVNLTPALGVLSFYLR